MADLDIAPSTARLIAEACRSLVKVSELLKAASQAQMDDEIKHCAPEAECIAIDVDILLAVAETKIADVLKEMVRDFGSALESVPAA